MGSVGQIRIHHRFFLIFFVSVFLISLQAQAKWQLVWSDEFNESGRPNLDKWSFDIGGNGWGNHEDQFYTDKIENSRIENGFLIIEARKENVENKKYSSARLNSRLKAHWRYGRVEIRAKLPTGRGTWPAFWMLPEVKNYGNHGWPDNGEIDIMEHVGFDPGVIHASVHTFDYNWMKQNQKTEIIRVPNAMNHFHTYAMEWNEDEVSIFIDGQKYFSYKNLQSGWTSWPFDKDFHLILNLAIGGFWGGQNGIDDSIFPQKMLVDYVRVYQQK